MTNLSDYYPQITRDDFYTPAMMQFDGSTGYYQDQGSIIAGNKITVVFRFSRASFTGDAQEYINNITYFVSGAGVYINCYSSDYSTDATLADKIIFTHGGLFKFITPAGFLDGETHSVFFEYDGDLGTGSLIIDGVDARDQTNPNDLLTTGTIDTNIDRYAVGALHNGNAGTHFDGKIGYCGLHDVGGLSYSDFFDSNNQPIKQDETTWANSGWGSQPIYWNEHGEMINSKGSALGTVRNGTIVVAPA